MACIYQGPLTRYVTLWVEHPPGMPGMFSRHRLQRKTLVSYHGMHHGTCIMHVPWYISGSLIRGGGENASGIPGACATCKFTYLARDPWYIIWCYMNSVLYPRLAMLTMIMPLSIVCAQLLPPSSEIKALAFVSDVNVTENYNEEDIKPAKHVRCYNSSHDWVSPITWIIRWSKIL